MLVYREYNKYLAVHISELNKYRTVRTVPKSNSNMVEIEEESISLISNLLSLDIPNEGYSRNT
jgi:hypothetical protein